MFVVRRNRQQETPVNSYCFHSGKLKGELVSEGLQWSFAQKVFEVGRLVHLSFSPRLQPGEWRRRFFRTVSTVFGDWVVPTGAPCKPLKRFP